MEFQEEIIRVNGGGLNVASAGKGRPILLRHGLAPCGDAVVGGRFWLLKKRADDDEQFADWRQLRRAGDLNRLVLEFAAEAFPA